MTPRLTVVARSPEPDAAPHAAAPDWPATEHVHVAPLMTAGRLSVTVAFTAACGPVFVTKIVYVMVLPAVTRVVPSVLVTPRFTCRATGVVVALTTGLSTWVGSVAPR